MKPIILFRNDLTTGEELLTAKKYLDVTDTRMGLSNSVVIGRYSVLPFYKELVKDLELQSSRLINSYRQHCYIANFEYYFDIVDLTPKTYFDLALLPEQGPFVVKGKTNSKKFDWATLMFASNKRRALEIAYELRKDSLLQQQDIIARDFVKLKILEEGINGLPFSNEWRFFCLGGKILSYGFYWTIAEVVGTMDTIGIDLVNEVIKRVRGRVNFFVVDIAEKEDGGWIVIEMNDGSMSGLSGNEADKLYSNMAKVMESYEIS